MLLQIGNQAFTIDSRQKITHETFTRRYTLVNLEAKLTTARQELLTVAPEQRRRQREKIKRLERQYDKLNLSL